MTPNLEQRLVALADLMPNWDGEGAPRIDRDIIAAARILAANFPDWARDSCHIGPGTRGNLQFEWEKHDAYLEVEFESPVDVTYLFIVQPDIEEERTVGIDYVGHLLRMFREATE